jgi:DNA-binding response OmpR family regulator
LNKFEDYTLSNNDIIELARASVALRFCDTESTVELPPAKDSNPPVEPPVIVDGDARDVWVDGIKLEPPLTLREFELLSILYRNMGKACSKNDLAQSWGKYIPADEQIEQIIHRIRERIEPDPSNPSRIITVRGYGYKLILTA